METSIQIAISPSDRSSGRPNHLIQMSWIATGMAPQDNQKKKKENKSDPSN